MRKIQVALLGGLSVLATVGVLGCGRSGNPTAAADDKPAVTVTKDAASDQTTAAPTRAAVDPCVLVSKQEAEQLAGTPLDDAKPIRETCTYTGPVTGPTAQVEIGLGDGAKKFLDIDRELGHDLKPLPGIGDETWIEDGTVFVSKSGLWVSIHLVRLDDPAVYRKPLEDLARKVAGRI
jgi:hypothetical protein